MLIHNHGQLNTPDLPRQSPSSGSPGTMSPLRFSTERTPTLRGSPPEALSRIGGFLTNLKFAVKAPFPQVRAQRESLDQTREISLRVGHLLSSLAAPADGSKAQSRVVHGLEQLGMLSEGDLANIPGGRESLSTYVGGLRQAELVAMRHGVLRRLDEGSGVLEQISPLLRGQVAGVLTQMVAALNQRLANDTVRVPLLRIASLLSASAVDGQKLKDQLTILSAGRDVLDIYLQSLAKDQSEALLTRLRPGKLAAARGALLRINDGSKERLALAMLDCLRVSVEREIHARAQPELRQLHDELSQATNGPARFVASLVLRNLSILVDKNQQAYERLPGELAEQVRWLVKDSLSRIRDAVSNLDGPLNEASLSKLDDLSLDFLCQALSVLQPMGLELDRNVVHTIGLQRVEALSQQVGDSVTSLFRMLSREPLLMPVLMQQLRDLSDMELQRTQHMVELGLFAVGGLNEDDRQAMTQMTCRWALDQLSHEEQGHIRVKMASLMALLKGLEDGFGKIERGLKDVAAQESYREGGAQIMKQLGATRHLLASISNAIIDRLSNPVGLELATDPLPSTFNRALREQYGVDHDPVTGEVKVLLSDSLRKKLIPELETLPAVGARATQKVTLPVDEMAKEFTVSEPLYEDGIEKSYISFSVRGSGPDGQPIRYTWPLHVSPDKHVHVMGGALDAIDQIAGPASESLMRLMDPRRIACAVKKGLQEIGLASSFKLDDGAVIHPGGQGPSGLDVALRKNEDGSFNMAMKITFSNLKRVPGMRPDGMKLAFHMEPRTSWAQVQFTLHASSDARQIDVVGLPQFRHYFDFKGLDRYF